MSSEPAGAPREIRQIGHSYDIQTPSDLSRVFIDAKGSGSYANLLTVWSNATRSMGAAHGYVTGRRVPTVQKLLELLDAIGARLVVEPTEPRSLPDGHAEIER